jgi:cytochrome c peroxidase
MVAIVKTRLGLRQGFLAVALGAGLAIAGQVVAAPELGPLPTLKVNKARAELGKRLFFDKRVSGDVGISCATCHEPKHGYASKDPRNKSPMKVPGRRHRPLDTDRWLKSGHTHFYRFLNFVSRIRKWC